MTTDDAYEIFGLKRGADWSEVQKEFRRLSSVTHSDKNSGDDTDMATLNVARDLLKDEIEGNKAMVPVNVIKDIVLATNHQVSDIQIAKERTELHFSKVLDITTNRIKDSKRFAAVIGSISAAAIFLGKDVVENALRATGARDTLSMEIALFVMALGVTSGFFWWMLDTKVKKIEQRVDDLQRNLSDNSFFVELLHQVLGDEINGSWEKLY